MEITWSKTKKVKKNKQKALKLAAIIILIGVTITRLFNLPKIIENRSLPCQGKGHRFPCQAENFLKENPGKCDNIFNTYE